MTSPGVWIEHEDEDVVVAHLSGEIDLATAPGVGDQLAEAVPNRALGLVIDLADTTYLDSSGVSLIFEIAERLKRRQQQLCVVVPDDAPLRRVLRIVNLDAAVPLVSTIADAATRIRAAV